MCKVKNVYGCEKRKNTYRKLYHQFVNCYIKKTDKSNKNTARVNRTYSIVPMFLYYNMSAFIFFLSGRMNFFNFWSLIWIRRRNVGALGQFSTQILHSLFLNRKVSVRKDDDSYRKTTKFATPHRWHFLWQIN